MSKAPTLSTIAAEVGVSIFTVSLALRNSQRVAASTREQVRVAAERLGYKPNPMVSALMTSIRNRRSANCRCSIALLVAQDDPQWEGQHRFIRDIRDGGARRARELGYSFTTLQMAAAKHRPARMQQILEARGIDGVILAPLPEHGYVLGLDWAKLAYVAVGFTFDEAPANRVAVNLYRTTRLAIEAVEQRGFKRIGMVMHKRLLGAVEDVLLACYLAYAYQRHGQVAVPPLLLDEAEITPERVIPWVKKHKVDAILGFRGAIPDWLREAGFAVGSEVGFAHLDCSPRSSRFAGIDQRMPDLGSMAVDLLIEQIQNNQRGVPAIPKLVEIDGDWRDGATMPKQVNSPAQLRPALLTQ
jgi:DNA-binding LacI/PurR family transcriptional regulator